jgi:hypothetical protein
MAITYVLAYTERISMLEQGGEEQEKPMISPIIVNRAEEATSEIVLKPTITFIGGREWDRGVLEKIDKPAHNNRLEISGVVSSCTGGTLSELPEGCMNIVEG